MRYFLFLLLTAILVACTAEVSQETPSPVAIIIETLPPAGDTPTATATRPATDTPTATATRPATDNPTETATPLPTLSPTPPPAPAGRILFFWDPNLPYLPTPSEGDPRFILYQVSPGVTVTEWSIQPISEQLYGIPSVALSPDQTKLAFTVIEDKNQDGSTGIKGFNLGADGKNIYLYDLVNGMFEQLTHDFARIYSITWADNQTLTYQNLNELFSVNIFNPAPYKIVPSLSSNTPFLSWSPDGANLAILFDSGQLNFFNHTQNEVISVQAFHNGWAALNGRWSFDGQWFASALSVMTGLAVVEAKSLNVFNLVEQQTFARFAWHPRQQQLAFTKGQSIYTIENGQLFLWDVNTGVSLMLYETHDISQPVWDLEGQLLWLGILEESGGGILTLDLTTNSSSWLWHSDNVTTIEPLTWSPDGQWLLFFSEIEERAGLFVIHKNGGSPYLILDTSGTYRPQSVFWLP